MDHAEININEWDFKKWFARPALVEKKSNNVSLYTGQRYDSKYFELIKDGWNHDHCLICFKTLSDIKDEETDDSGYFYYGDWICETCFNRIKQNTDKK